MIAPDNNPLCQKARLYYYDFLEGHRPEEISDELWQHMDSCNHCQTSIHLLETQIGKADIDPEIAQTSIVTTVSLGIHFAHVDKPVGCNIVKPFIPLLADSGLAIRTSTPITAHIDHCRQCLADIESLQALKLKRQQLLQLGQILVEAEDVDKNICKHARIAVPAIAALAVDEVSASMLKHVCVCPECRELTFQYRQEIIDRLKSENKNRSEEFPCDSVTDDDLFDYCFPYGIDPAKDEYAKFRPSLTSHVSKCVTCLSKMQHLHQTISQVIDRAESGIQTVFSVVGKSEEQPSKDTKDVCSDSRIEVKVLDSNSEGTLTSVKMPKQDAGQEEQTPPAVKLARWVKPLVAAAVFLAILLILHSRPLKATDLSQIYENLAKVKNIHIVRIDPEHSRVFQEIWIARGLELKMFKDGDQYVLWDIKGKARKTKNFANGATMIAPLDNETIKKVKSTLFGPLDMLPFTQIAKVPKDSKWYRVADESIETVIDDTEAYDMDWMEKSLSGSLIHKKWRGYIEIGTKLPVRIEWYDKRATEEEYSLINTATLAYPATSEILSLTRSIGF